MAASPDGTEFGLRLECPDDFESVLGGFWPRTDRGRNGLCGDLQSGADLIDDDADVPCADSQSPAIFESDFHAIGNRAAGYRVSPARAFSIVGAREAAAVRRVLLA